MEEPQQFFQYPHSEYQVSTSPGATHFTLTPKGPKYFCHLLLMLTMRLLKLHMEPSERMHSTSAIECDIYYRSPCCAAHPLTLELVQPMQRNLHGKPDPKFEGQYQEC